MVFLQVLGGAMFILMSAFFLWIIAKIAKLEKNTFGFILRTAALVGIVSMSLNQITNGVGSLIILGITLILSIALVKKFHDGTWVKSITVACIWTLLTTGTTMALAYVLGLLIMGAGFQTIAAIG